MLKNVKIFKTKGETVKLETKIIVFLHFANLAMKSMMGGLAVNVKLRVIKAAKKQQANPPAFSKMKPYWW